MENAIELNRIMIKCDACGFMTEGDPKEWQKKSCPECGDTNVITDQDLEILENMFKVMDAVNALTPKPKENATAATISISSNLFKE